ncbi:trigger factor [Desulfobulbus propionicus DSM 2032]|jgi:trigger factor|uniref:Trigger factor n=1 Tax=Desulfobulbus propionicus (strain ATCC 33891 / DSM 2032 / VKM B-1956 / 1pr3) TaxID=577650 RepID=A0A7U3YMM2_DESPD|nr:trigger factor [Desulfobulbus propionicus]ADW18183.1 trigger factor [Desulfobulbus propionicus DSM 2032]
MEIVVEHLSDLTKKLTITLPKETVGPALEKAYAKINKEVKLKGFRRGKIPQSVLENNFGAQIQAEVGEKLVQESYFDAIEKEKLEPVVHPEITEHNFPEDGTFVYVALVDIKPQFELKEYKGLEVEKPVVTVSDEEVENEIKLLQRHQAVLQTAEEGHAIAMDDVAIVDFQGFHNGKAMKEVRNENFSVDIGMHRLGKDFEEKLLGLKKGDKTLYEITFPADYPNPLLAGKTVEFKVDVKDVKVRVKPELDDEFAKDIKPELTTLEELKKDIRDRLQKTKDDALKGDLDDKIMHKLIDLNPFEVPQRLVNYEIQEMLKQTEENLKRSGLSFESAGINLEELVEKNKEVAVKRVKGDFLLKKIAEIEEIKIADEDIQRGYQRIADQYRMTLDEVKKYFKRREEILPFMNELHNEKILNFLREQAKFIEVAAATEPSAAQAEA